MAKKGIKCDRKGPHSRAHIQLSGQKEAMQFVQDMEFCPGNHYIENFNGTLRVNAKSIMGVMYAMAEFNDELYLVNDSEDGKFSSLVDAYRK